ncbi:MAG: GNAT family N-acetyltransferase, partial [Firmicutes bacterium]|nr:GNAT family N-acetyltransferase [Bacillota bacterium]
YRLFAIEDDEGRLIGDLELDHISWRRREAELRIRIGEKERWNEGYGTDAVRTLLALAFGRMKLRRVYLKVYRFNRRAIRCYEKSGFRKEGILRRRDGAAGWKDIILMSVEVPDEGWAEAAAAAEGHPGAKRNQPPLRRRKMLP